MPEERARRGHRPLAIRMVVGFGRFWWEFLIGDTPELFLGVVAVLGLVAAICLDHSFRTVAAAILPLSVGALLVASTLRAKRKSAARPN